MKNAKRIVAMTLVTALCLFSFVLTGSTEAIAEYTPTLSMLHTSGKYIYNEENERITLRGNLCVKLEQRCVFLHYTSSCTAV